MCTDEFGKDFYFLLRHEENSSRELGGCCCVCRTEQILESSIRSIDIRSILQSYHVVRGVRAYPSQMKISSHSLKKSNTRTQTQVHTKSRGTKCSVPENLVRCVHEGISRECKDMSDSCHRTRVFGVASSECSERELDSSHSICCVR